MMLVHCLFAAGGKSMTNRTTSNVPLPAEPGNGNSGSTGPSGYAVTGIFVILAIQALYFGREFFMPVVLAFLFALTLTPIVRFLRKRGIPSPLSATLLVAASSGVVGLGGYLLSGPAMELVNDAPQIGYRLTDRIEELRGPF